MHRSSATRHISGRGRKTLRVVTGTSLGVTMTTVLFVGTASASVEPCQGLQGTEYVQCVADNSGPGTPFVGDTGSALAPTPYVPTTDEAPVIAAKMQALQQVEPYIDALLVDGLSANSSPGAASATSVAVDAAARSCPDGKCPMSAKTLGNQPLHAEGEGNGTKTYTCGPASTRNLIQQATGRDYGEYQFEVWEGTSSSTGTGTDAIVRALNGHFRNVDTWTSPTPSSPGALMSMLAQDISGANHGVILNVNTTSLPFWFGAFARHYDLAYGYDTRGAGSASIAEEWQHAVDRAGHVPYGYRTTALSDAYAAVHGSPTQQVIY